MCHGKDTKEKFKNIKYIEKWGWDRNTAREGERGCVKQTKSCVPLPENQGGVFLNTKLSNYSPTGLSPQPGSIRHLLPFEELPVFTYSQASPLRHSSHTLSLRLVHILRFTEQPCKLFHQPPVPRTKSTWWGQARQPEGLPESTWPKP